jgi:hypothetical protein
VGSAAPHVVCYLAEWYRPEVTQQPIDETVAKLDAVAATMRVEGALVKLVVTLAVPTDEVIYGVFAARSPDIVVQACRRAGIPLERLSSDVAARITRVGRDEELRFAPDLRETPDSSLAASCKTFSFEQTERP